MIITTTSTMSQKNVETVPCYVVLEELLGGLGGIFTRLNSIDEENVSLPHW